MDNYYELLKDWHWLDKSEEIQMRDNRTCQSCNSTIKTLHVHHIVYYPELKPWQYPNDDLITLCDDCHKFITKKIKECHILIRRICITDSRAEQLLFLLESAKEKNEWEIRHLAKKL